MMLFNSNAHDNLGFIIDYNVTSSLCSIRKIRWIINLKNILFLSSIYLPLLSFIDS